MCFEKRSYCILSNTQVIHWFSTCFGSALLLRYGSSPHMCRRRLFEFGRCGWSFAHVRSLFYAKIFPWWSSLQSNLHLLRWVPLPRKNGYGVFHWRNPFSHQQNDDSQVWNFANDEQLLLRKISGGDNLRTSHSKLHTHSRGRVIPKRTYWFGQS